MQKSRGAITRILGVAGLVFASYVLISSLNDIRRYIRISTM